MDLPREGNIIINFFIFDISNYVACATFMFFDANSNKFDCENISDIFCKVETNQTNDFDNYDTYDLKDMAFCTKNFKRSFRKKTNLRLTDKLKQCEKEKIDALHELVVFKRKNMNLESDMHSLF